MDRRTRATAIRSRNKAVNCILLAIASAIVLSSLVVTWYQTRALAALHPAHEKGTAPEPSRQAHEKGGAPEPIRFVSVVGPFHTGTKAIWQSIRNNEGIASEQGIELRAYATSHGGYPPCGVPLLSDATIDMTAAMGGTGNVTAGISQPNAPLFAQYGTLWADWNKRGPSTQEGVLKMKPPHTNDVFYTGWKHTPPQHPLLACSRSDTLYVIAVRHPKAWQERLKRKSYDFGYDPRLKLWRLVRSDPRRLPPLEVRFRSLYNAWEFYMTGYLAWEEFSAGRNCYSAAGGGGGEGGARNCLWGDNEISRDRRNVVIVRYEDYLMNPKKVLAQIYSFATRGKISSKDEDKFVPFKEEKVEELQEMLKHLQEADSFSSKEEDWEGATELTRICELLGYSCDESPAMLRD